MKFKRVHLSPMRIPPQQEAARALIAELRGPFPIATYLDELIARNRRGDGHEDAQGPYGPAPVEPAVEALVE